MKACYYNVSSSSSSTSHLTVSWHEILSLSLFLSLSLTKGYSLSHRLQGTVNQTTGLPTNHKAAAGWCNHSHTDTGWHTHTHTQHTLVHAHTHTLTAIYSPVDTQTHSHASSVLQRLFRERERVYLRRVWGSWEQEEEWEEQEEEDKLKEGVKVCHFSRQKFSSEGLLARGVFSFSWPLISPPSCSSSLPRSFFPSLWLNFEIPSQISLPLTAVTGLITEQMKWNTPTAALKDSNLPLLPWWLALSQHSFSQKNKKWH